MTLASPRLVAVLAALLAMGLGACSDALDQDTTAGQVLAVLNTGSADLTLLDLTRRETRTVTLAPGAPAGLDARGPDLVIALGDSDAVQIASLTASGSLVRLASGSRPTSVAIADDSIAWIVAGGADRVVMLNYRRGDTASYPTGPSPQAVVLSERDVLVLNAHLAGGRPAGAGSVSWFARESPTTSGTFPLSCAYPRHAALGGDGVVYVVCAGTPGAADGRLSLVDPGARAEIAVLNGLGESPGPVAYHPGGRVLIASAVHGILEVDATRRSVDRGPGAGVKPGGEGVDVLAVDTRGRIYAAAGRGCTAPGTLYVLTPPPDYRLTETRGTGVCPRAMVVAGTPPGP